MSPRLARMLTRLYPQSWRQRYGAEFEAFLETGSGGLGTLANVVWSALCERHLLTRSVQFESWCVRAPWAMFSLAPLLLLAGAWFVALFILWCGWKVFLPGADTPFVPIYELREIFYFNAGRVLYFGAPILVGWGIGVVAARQRLKAVWPTAGLVLIALIGGTGQVHAGRTAVPSGLGHIRMDFTFGPSVHGVPDGLFHVLMIFSLTALPYLLWRWQKFGAW
jgi:hypothetical protein